MQDAYLKALKDCEKISREEFKKAHEYSSRCNELVQVLNDEFSGVISNAEKVTAKNKIAANGLKDIRNSLGADYEEMRAKQTLTLEQQKTVLKKFSVMLFGRTMAGKSTIREAITKGDGSTIGKGAQRTTRDVREYEWNHLRIIDTPGFGAFNGEEDTDIARGILEQSDVILFMLNSDSIQESTFTELEYVYRLNKPLIFVINVKKGLEKNVYRKKAINDSGTYLYSKSKLDGHKQRLQEQAAKLGMNPKHIHIIPIHAQAAFLATQDSYVEQSEDLHRISRLDDLLSLLTVEITNKGQIRRIQTLLGTALNHTDELEKVVAGQKKSVCQLLKEYKHTLARVDKWHNRTSARIPKKIEQDVGWIFSPLMKSISSFVDDNIQSESFSSRLGNHITSFDLEDKCEKLTKKISEEISQDLNEFNREMAKNLELSEKLNISSNQRSFDPFDYKRMNGWASSGLGVLAVVAFSNNWNPIGWALAAAGFVFSIFQIFSDSKMKKLQAEKRRCTNDIRDKIADQRDKVTARLTKWFSKDIEKKQIIIVKSELQEVCKGLERFIESLDQALSDLDRLEGVINERYLLRVMDVTSRDEYRKPNIKRIVRQPGYACYFKVSNYFKEPDLLERVQELIGEKIKVVYEDTIENMIFHVLGLHPRSANVVETNGEYCVYAQEKHLGRIIGKQHRNIMLASAICDVKLSVKPMP